MLLCTQDFLATKYHGKQVSECPSIAGGARDKCAGEGAERMPCFGKVNSAVLLTHEQRCGTSTAAAATQKLGGDGLKLYFMQDHLLPTLLVSKSEIPSFNGLITQVWGFVHKVLHLGLACSSSGRPQAFSLAEILSCDLRFEYPRKEAHSRCMSTRGSPHAFCSRLPAGDWSPQCAQVPKSQPILPAPGSQPLSSPGYSILRAKIQQI